MDFFNLKHKKLFEKPFFFFLLLLGCGLHAIDIPNTEGIKSLESLKFMGVHEQGADRSCGLSVVSSILNLYLGHDTDENTLIRQFHALLQESEELNLLQMMNIFSTYGYVSKTYRTDVANLIKAVELYAPVIVHYEKPVHLIMEKNLQSMKKLQKKPKWTSILLTPIIYGKEDLINTRMAYCDNFFQREHILKILHKRGLTKLPN